MKRLCGKYLGDNDATCPQLTCIREYEHPGLCDNVSDRPDPTPSLVRYKEMVDRLRARRGQPGWVAGNDRGLLAELDDLYMTLTPAEQDEVESEGWRWWPHLYDRHMKDGA